MKSVLKGANFLIWKRGTDKNGGAPAQPDGKCYAECFEQWKEFMQKSVDSMGSSFEGNHH